MDWKSVEEKIVQDDQNKWDRKVPGKTSPLHRRGFWKSPTADRPKILLLYRIWPRARCAVGSISQSNISGASQMRAFIANYDFKRLNGYSDLLRGKGEWVRAFSLRRVCGLQQFSNHRNGRKSARQGRGHGQGILEETHMFLKIVSEELWDVESRLKAGIMVGNSEVGRGSVSVEPFVFRKPCTNDLVVAQEKSFRHAHIHLTDFEVTRRMAEAISEGFRLASAIL